MPQFRALVVLDSNGGQRRVGELAQELRISPSTATRLCDRLVRKQLVRRDVDPTNRREVAISLSSRGRDVVRTATRRRRVEIASIMSKVPPAQRATIIDALTAFRDAAGEDASLQTVPW